jgi:hypothetical protein
MEATPMAVQTATLANDEASTRNPMKANTTMSEGRIVTGTGPIRNESAAVSTP